MNVWVLIPTIQNIALLIINMARSIYARCLSKDFSFLNIFYKFFHFILKVCLTKTPKQKTPTVDNMSPVVLIKPISSNRRPEIKYPQTIAVVKGKKYVMVAKPLALPNE